MPFKKKQAFVSAEEVSTDDLPRVIAHELGHGTFRLYHTFSEKNDYLVPRGTTDNLMDYNQGKELHKYQWDLIKDPQGEAFAIFMDEEEVAMVSEEDTLNTNITAVNDSVFVQGEENTFEVEFEIDNWDALIDKYTSESHLIKALVFNNDDELIYVDNEIAPYSNGTITWDGTYEDEDGDTRTIDKEGAPYEFVVMAFCGDDPEVLKDELSCGFWGIRSCTMKEFLYNEEETRQKLRDETGDSVLVVFSHDGFKIEYKERNKAERLLHDIRQANFNGNKNLDITEFYEQVSSDPTYKTAIEINEEEIDLMVEHKAYTGGDHVISPLEEDVIGPTINPNTDEYNHHIKFKGLIDGDNEDMLYLRVKTSEKMDKLEDYLFGNGLPLSDCRYRRYYGNTIDIENSKMGCERTEKYNSCKGIKNKRPHHGVDLEANIGTPIKAFGSDIKVISIGSMDGYGKYLTVKATLKNRYTYKSETLYILYTHLQDVSVREDEDLIRGQIIGHTGNTGNAANLSQKEEHLHLEILTKWPFNRNFKCRKNPVNYINIK